MSPFIPELNPALDCCVWCLPRGLNGNKRFFPPKPVAGFDFCSPPPALMLRVSAGWLGLFGGAMEQVWHRDPRSPLTLCLLYLSVW